MGDRFDDRFDVAVIGAGVGGGTCARTLRAGGMRVALIERNRIGGETAYWASVASAPVTVPSGRMSLLRRLQAAAGIALPPGTPASAFGDELLETTQDEVLVNLLQREGIAFLRGAAHLLGNGRIAIDDRVLMVDRIVIATGCEPHAPEIEGLRDSGFWTHREAATFSALPSQIVIIGGRTRTIELSQMFRHFGSNVTVLTKNAQLLDQEDPGVGDLLVQHLYHSGVRVVTGRAVQRIVRDGDGWRVLELDDGSHLQAQELVVVSYRPSVDGLGLEHTGVHVSQRGIEVDMYCRAAEGIWAIGDVTGHGSFVHMAQYQARLAADDILGHGHPGQFLSVPRVSFTQPQIAAVGLTLAAAHEQGLDVASTSVEVPMPDEDVGVPEQQASGQLTLHVDRQRGVLVGMWIVAPEIAEWIPFAVLAIRTAIPLVVLRDTLEQFPTMGELYMRALSQITD
jgi:pyruvate/2-oxoglutarate dehydrogenase complex dihydrolipoamide dehydrogenase (E3) component